VIGNVAVLLRAILTVPVKGDNRNFSDTLQQLSATLSAAELWRVDVERD
jgi:hypothetical protein